MKKESPIIKDLSYEEAISELEKIVNRLETDQVTLEESMCLFERGQVLNQHCQKLLEDAELKIRNITPVFSPGQTHQEDN